MLAILYRFQPLIVPAFILLTAWATAVTVFKRDNAVGFALYISLIIVVDWFFNTGIYIPGLQYGSIRYSEALSIVLIATAPEKRTRIGIHKVILLLIGLYFFLMFAAALRGFTLIDGLNNFRRVMVPQILTFWIAQRGFRRTDDYQRFFSHLILLLILIGLFSFWDVFYDTTLLHSDSLNSPEYYLNRSHGRFGSFFLNPIDLGDFAVLLFPVMLLATRAQRTWLTRAICWAGMLLFTFAFIKAQSRGAMVGFVVSVMFFTLLPYKHFPIYRRALSLMMVVLLLSALLPGFYETATRRFDDSSSDSETSLEELGRASTWNHVITEVIPAHPLIGIGLGEAQFIQVMTDTGFAEAFGRTLDNPHSSYLEMAVAAGVPALLIFVLLNILVIATNVSYLRKNVEQERALLVLGLTSGILGFLVATTSGQDMFRVSVAPLYWLIIGLCLSMTSNVSTEPQIRDGKLQLPLDGVPSRLSLSRQRP